MTISDDIKAATIGALAGAASLVPAQPLIARKVAEQMGLPKPMGIRGHMAGYYANVAGDAATMALSNLLNQRMVARLQGNSDSLPLSHKVGVAFASSAVSGLCINVSNYVMNQHRALVTQALKNHKPIPSYASTMATLINRGSSHLVRSMPFTMGKEGVFGACWIVINPAISSKVQEATSSPLLAKTAGIFTTAAIGTLFSQHLDTAEVRAQEGIKGIELFKGGFKGASQRFSMLGVTFLAIDATLPVFKRALGVKDSPVHE